MRAIRTTLLILLAAMMPFERSDSSRAIAQTNSEEESSRRFDVALVRVESVLLDNPARFRVGGELDSYKSCVLLYVRVPFAAAYHSSMGPPIAMVGDAMARIISMPAWDEGIVVYAAPTLGAQVSDLVFWFVPEGRVVDGKELYQLPAKELSKLRDLLDDKGFRVESIGSMVEKSSIREEVSITGIEYLRGYASEVLETLNDSKPEQQR